MENTTPVGKEALKYRIAINEGIGVIITFAATALVAIALYVIKLNYAILIDVVVFLCIFLLQLILDAGVVDILFSLQEANKEIIKYFIALCSIK